MSEFGDRATPQFRAFICHASEDKILAGRLARDLHAAGIDTFFDQWEIKAGESLRARIDDGLGSCTHFIVLLSESSLTKPWVNAEIDAGFILKVQGRATLIPLRYRLGANRLPPLLAPLLSPELLDYERDVASLIDDINGISRKPPVAAMEDMTPSWGRSTRLSALAAKVAELLATLSASGRSTPGSELEVELLQETTRASDKHLIDAVSELEDMGLVRPQRSVGNAPFGYLAVEATDRLFWTVDKYVMGWEPAKDAVRVAAETVNAPTQSVQIYDLAEHLGWPPRRLNPALSFLISHRLVLPSPNLDAEYVTSEITISSATRRFVRDNS